MHLVSKPKRLRNTCWHLRRRTWLTFSASQPRLTGEICGWTGEKCGLSTHHLCHEMHDNLTGLWYPTGVWTPTQSRRRAELVGSPNYLNRIPSLLFMPVTTHHTRQLSVGRLVFMDDLMERQCINKSCSSKMSSHKSAVVYSESASETTFHNTAPHPCPKNARHNIRIDGRKPKRTHRPPPPEQSKG